VAILKRKDSGLKGLATLQDRIQVFNPDTYEDISFAIGKFAPGVVVHLAALYINRHKPGEIAGLINSNILFGTHVLEAMQENSVTKFLTIGTRWQHIGNKRYCPANLYAATKEAFKDILVYYGTRGIKHKTIELCDTYGAGDTRKKILDLLIAACQKHEPVDLSPGGQVLDLSSVDDICRFILTGIQSETFFDNTTASLGGTVIKLRDLGKIVEEKYKTAGFLRWGAKPYRDREVMTPPVYFKKIQLNQNSLEDYLENMQGSQ
jgi:nucleoside-diphosphate-sugar epimerase